MSYCNRFRAVARQSLRQGQRFNRFRPVLTQTVPLRQFSDPFSLSSPVLKPTFSVRAIQQVPNQGANMATNATSDGSEEGDEAESGKKSPSGTSEESDEDKPNKKRRKHDPGPDKGDEYVEFADEPAGSEQENEKKEASDTEEQVEEPPKVKKPSFWGSFKKTVSSAMGGVDDDNSRTDELEARIQVLEAHNLKLKTMGVNLQDDMERLRKRTEKEKQEISTFAVSKFAKELLIVQDNFQLAMKNMSPECCEQIAKNPEIQAIVDGVKMTQKTLDQTLNKFEITQIASKGEIADYNLHEVMFTTKDKTKKNLEIVEVLREGYLIKDRVLRNAQVGVVKND